MDQDDTAEKDPKSKLPSEVSFEHAFFHTIEETSFRILEDSEEPVMIMVLDKGEVSLKFIGVRHELNLDDDEPDSKMLDIIADGLKYVRELRVGDPIPSELTSGKASWEITDEHRALAHNRVTMQLVSWMSGEEMLITDPNQLAQVADDPKTKEKISRAFSEAAKALGIAEENREDVISLIANLANELSYIEALRVVFHEVEHIYLAVLELEHKYKSEQSVLDTIASIKRLFRIVLDGFNNSFDELDAQTGEILSALTNIGQVTRYIRGNRDDLHRRLWAWDGLIEDWRNLPIKHARTSELHMNELYHFLAQRFLPRNEWELYSKAMDKTKKRATEVIW